MSPIISGSEINKKDLDNLLRKIEVIANKLTKIRACGNETNARIAKNNLWVLYWALQTLLRYLNQDNLTSIELYIEEVNDFANKVISEDRKHEVEYLVTLLEQMEARKHEVEYLVTLLEQMEARKNVT